MEGWINKIQREVAQELKMRPNDPEFDDQVESKIRQVVQYIEDLVHGFIKLLSKFVAEIGYKGLLILIDEAVNLYQISTTVTREKNYNRLLAMFNDTMQCNAEHLGIFIGGTTQFLEDPHRGLFADQAWRRRTKESRFVAQSHVQEYTSPVIRLSPLTEKEIYLLLQKLAEIHAINFSYNQTLNNADIQGFVQEMVGHLGGEVLFTPGEIIWDFISIMNVIYQSPEITLSDLIRDAKLPLIKSS